MNSNLHEDTNLVAELTDELAGLAQAAEHIIPDRRSGPAILNQLYGQIEPVDFWKLAGLDPDDDNAKLKSSDYLVLIAQEVLKLAEHNRWNICRRTVGFFIYNGAYWQPIDEDDLRRFLGQAAEKMGVGWLKARSVDFTKKLFEQFAEAAYMPAPLADLNVIKIGVLNGTYEITPDYQRLGFNAPENFITYQLPFRYDPEALALKFQRFLDQVLPDKSCQMVLAEYLGYIFINPSRLKLEKAMMLYGSGANGKSVLFEIVMALLGRENVSNFSFEKLTTNPAYRAQIQNMLLNYSSEGGGSLDATILKQLISIEPVEARLLYSQAFTMTNYAKLMVNTNELPSSPEHTHAYFRRFIILPFLVTIPESEQDKQLATKIIASELSGVFNWVLAGLRRLIAQGRFTDCEAAANQLEAYKRQSDSVRLFLDDNEYVASPDQYTTLKELYRDYKGYCIEDGLLAVKMLNFHRRLNSGGIQTERRNVGNVAFVRKATARF